MNYLLDTCVISELIKPLQDHKFLQWIESQNENQLFISVLCIGEICKGIAKLQDSTKKRKLEDWIENDLQNRFVGRILEITENIAVKWGDLSGSCERKGKKLPVIDGLIAATGIENNMTVVTRNTKDFFQTGCEILNPWEL